MRKYVTIGSVLALLALTYCIGRYNGGRAQLERQLEEDTERCKELAELDRSFLRGVTARPIALTAGIYILETRFPGKPAELDTLEITVSDEGVTAQSLKMGEGLFTDGFKQDGQVFSGQVYNTDEKPNRTYVGLIDGNMIWGRVYVPPGTGWHEGEPSAIGVWRLYPKEQE